MATVAVVNQKGGVGKTTVTLGLAAAATLRGMSTLVVDLDPQGNATTGLGVFEPSASIAEALSPETGSTLASITTKAAWPDDRPAIPELAASDPGLALVEKQLADDPLGAQGRLAELLADDPHDLVLLDCPPSVGLLTINALFAADRVLVVAEPGAWAHDAVDRMLDTVERVSRRRAREPALPRVAAVVVNRLGRTRDNTYWAGRLAAAHVGVGTAEIRLRAAIPEAAATALPLDSLGRRPGAAESAAEFAALLDRLLAA